MSTQISNSERLGYSSKEVAALLGCSEKHIKNLIEAGELQSVKFGKRRIIPASALLHKLEGQVNASEDKAA
jgi:excisionase family DNA binding protein